jgi:dihydropteroate synthase-like protein
MPREQIHFVTGKLAEFSLRDVLAKLAPQVGFDYTIGVLNITVAALMTTEWIAKRLQVPTETTRVLLPGYCQGDLAAIQAAAKVPIERGPHDLRRLPEFFGHESTERAEYGAYDIEILAEINHAPRLPLDEILQTAAALRADGADVIDVGCNPGETWSGVGDAVKALVDAGHRVSIDSMNVTEIASAVRTGASLVLSVNSTNRTAAPDWGCEVVVVPDVPTTLEGLDETIEFLASRNVPLRIDAILEPIGFGFAKSLGRYLSLREKYPDAEMMMGIGNLTELTDADSAAINVMLLGFCEELGIHSVLTTQVINWAQSSVKECDLARRLVYHAVRRRTLPKHLEPQLVMLRDKTPATFGNVALDQLAAQIRDHNFRLFAESGELHALSAGQHLQDTDPFLLFNKMQAISAKPIDASHAFYLGYELAKAMTALTLGKDYRQDESLDWGFLTRPEQSHLARRATEEQP